VLVAQDDIGPPGFIALFLDTEGNAVGPARRARLIKNTTSDRWRFKPSADRSYSR